jgi:thiol-disulfide isomerase/thioredoxin
LRRAFLLLAGLLGAGALGWLVIWVKQNRGAHMEARPANEAAQDAAVTAPPEFVPPFKASTFEGKPFSIASYEGERAVVIDFWASWCAPCAADIPRLQAIAASYGKDGVALIGIHRGDRESAEKGIAFAARIGIDYTLVQDPDGKLFNLLSDGKPYMPLTLFINKEGIIRDRRIGPKTEEEIRVSMAKIVAP